MEIDVPHDELIKRKVRQLSVNGKPRSCALCARTPRDGIKTWFVLTCASMSLDNATYCPACTDRAEDANYSTTTSVSEEVVISSCTISKVSSSDVAPVLVPRLQNATPRVVIELPTLAPGIGRTIVPVKETPERKLVTAINNGGLFSDMLYRLRDAGQKLQQRRSGKWHPAITLDRPASFSSMNIFDRLPFPMQDEGGVNPFVGYIVPKHNRASRIPDVRYVAWVNRCIERKRFLFDCALSRRTRISCSLTGTKRLSSDIADIAKVWFGSNIRKARMTLGHFRLRFYRLANTFLCPTQPFTLLYKRGVVTLLHGGPVRGLSAIVAGRGMIGHMGINVSRSPTPSDHSTSVLKDEYHVNTPDCIKRCKRCWQEKSHRLLRRVTNQEYGLSSDWLCVWCEAEVTQKISGALARKSMSKLEADEFLSHQASIDEVTTPLDETTSIDTETVFERLGIDKRPLGLWISPTVAFMLVYVYKLRYGCPRYFRIDVRYSSQANVTWCTIMLPTDKRPNGLYLSFDDFDLFHAGTSTSEKISIGQTRSFNPCNHDKIQVCSSMAKRVGVNSQSDCESIAGEARFLLIAKKPSMRYWLTGNVIAFHVNNTVIVSRRRNIYRLDDDNVITTMQKNLFWSSSSPLYLTLAGLKRIYEEKKRRGQHELVAQLALFAGMSLKLYHEFMAEISADARFPDVTTDVNLINSAISRFKSDVHELQADITQLKRQIADHVQTTVSRAAIDGMGAVNKVISNVERRKLTSPPSPLRVHARTRSFASGLTTSPFLLNLHKPPSLTKDGDVESNPGPPHINTDIPLVNVNSPTPLTYSAREYRRHAGSDFTGLSYVRLLHNSVAGASEFELVNQHLSQRIRDTGSNLTRHMLWRDKHMLIQHQENKVVVQMSEIKPSSNMYHEFISSAFSSVPVDYQQAVDIVGILTYNKIDDRAIEHVILSLSTFIKTYAKTGDMEELLYFATAWKACMGCPAKGMVSIMLNSQFFEYTLSYSDYTPKTGGQINWMIDGDLIAHCGGNDDHKRGRSDGFLDPKSRDELRSRSRSRSVTELGTTAALLAKPTIGEQLIRAASPLRSKISSTDRLMTIVGAEGFGSDKVFSEVEGKEFLRKYLLNQNGDVEDLYSSINQGCSTGVVSQSGMRFYQNNFAYNGIAQQLQAVEPYYPSIQKFCDWIGEVKASQDIMDVDNRNITDLKNGLVGAFQASQPGLELCAVAGMALAWKKRWGCPDNHFICIFADQKTRTWNIHTFEDFEAETPGMYWFWNDRLLCHCGQEKPPQSRSRYLPHFQSPYDSTICTTRSYPALDGHVQPTLRHHLQHSGVRRIDNKGMHGLPLDFLEDINKEKASWFDETLDFIEYVHINVEAWLKRHGHKYVAVTANTNFTSWKWPVVNFINSTYDYVEEKNPSLLVIHTRMNGPALRGIRIFPCFFPSRALGFLIANGNSADWEHLRPLEPTSDLPWPKCSVFWVGPYAVNNMWVKPNCLTETITRRQFINGMTVYGGDEVVFNHIEVNTVMIHPDKGWTPKPFMGVPLATDHPINVKIWNKSGNLLAHWSRSTFKNHCDVYHKFHPGRPVLASCLHRHFADYVPWGEVGNQIEFINAYKRITTLEHPRCENPMKCEMCGPQQHTQQFTTLPGSFKKGPPGNEILIEIVDLHVYIPCLIWFYFLFYFRFLRSFSNPFFSSNHPWVSRNEEELPSFLDSQNITKALTMQTLGTKGDVLPIGYLANVAANVGVPVHIREIHNSDTAELEGLKQGSFWPVLPAYSDLSYASKLGYKATFQPHAAPSGPGAEYSLSPPKRWINKVNFADDFWSLPSLRKLSILVMNYMVEIRRPKFYVGALKGCSIPRAVTDKEPLRKRKNLGIFEAGWTSGSASIEVIPKYIRDKYPEIPKGDHSQIFRNYKTIHCHGGAGTMQTIIACGAQPVSHDRTLDRDYRRPLKSDDFKQPSLSIFYGWLIFSGFKVKMPWWPYFKAIMSYSWYQRQEWVLALIVTLLKAYVLWQAFMSYHLYILAIALATPAIIYRTVTSYCDLRLPYKILSVIWSTPYMMFCSWPTCLFLIALHFDAVLLIGQDIFAWRKREFSVVCEEVTRGGYTTIYPFGHYSILDHKTGLMYEGRFTNKDSTNLESDFKFCEVPRSPRKGAVLIPVQLRLTDIKAKVALPTGTYNVGNNCTTMMLSLVAKRSFFVTIWLVVVILMTGIMLTFANAFEWYMQCITPTFRLRNHRVYDIFGFAAEAGDVSFELEPLHTAAAPQEGIQEPMSFPFIPEENTEEEEEVHGDPAIFLHTNSRHNVDEVNSERCLPELIKEIATITAVMLRETQDESEHDIIREAGNRALAIAVSDLELPDDPVKMEEPIPLYRKTTWQEVRDQISEAFKVCKTIPYIAEFILWLDTIKEVTEQMAKPIFELLMFLLKKVYDFGHSYLSQAWKAVCSFLDHVLGEDRSTRIKTVWGPTGLWRSSYLDPHREFEATIAESKFDGKTTFLRDYENLVSDLKRHAEMHPVARENIDLIGGVQSRPIKLGTPMMSHHEANMLGLHEDEYHTTPLYEDLMNEIIKSGVPQGSDGVFFAQRNPERIDKSFARYEHQYSREYDPSKEALVLDVTHAIINQFDSSFADAKVTPMTGVTKYMKLKYSSGLPFLQNKATKSRRMLQEKGFLDILQSLATEYLQTGRFPVEFFHGFEKSQVVDLGKLLAGKNVRTVVANFLLTTYMEQIFQLDRNKRETWQDTGLGSGMPMNQSMAPIWEEIADKMKLNGGRLLLMDATEFDSKLSPLLMVGAAEIDKYSFKNHENGKNIASVCQAKYEALQDAWIIGITRPESKALCIGSHDKDTFNFLNSSRIRNLVSIHDLADSQEVLRLKGNPTGLHEYYQGLKAPDGAVILVHGKDQCPKNAHWNGSFEFGDPTKPYVQERSQRAHLYRKRDHLAMQRDVRDLCQSDFSLTSRVFDKARGGATGFTSTTFTNSWTFRIGVITAWCLTTGKQPKDFFEGNIFKNTSDDTIWLSQQLAKVKDIWTFQQHCKDLGITLTLSTTRDITQAEYLSKTVSPPTEQDSAEIQSWKYWKTRALALANKLDPNNADDMAKFNNPRFLVKQNVTAINMRRTALRYYQGSPSKYLYTMITRDAGHAAVCAFRSGLYCEIAQSYCAATNALLKQHNIHQRWELRWETTGTMTVKLPHVLQVNPRWKEQKLSPRQIAVLTYIKQQAKFPSYLKVIDVHMNIKTLDPQGHSKFLAKLTQGPRGWDSAARQVTDWLVTTTNMIPDRWAERFMPGVQAAFPDNPFYTKNEWVAKFALATLCGKMPPENIDYPMFAGLVATTPYGAITNTLVTWENWNDPSWRDEFMTTDHRLFKCAVIGISLIYLGLEQVDRYIKKIAYIGTLWSLYAWSFWGVKKIYGVSNTIHYHATGESSSTISGLMPKDQFVVTKRIAAVITDFVPVAFFYLLFPISFLFEGLVEPFKQGARIYARGQDVTGTIVTNTNVNNPWIEFATPYVEKLTQQPNKRAYVSAPTSTGKSTAFPAAILGERHKNGVKRVWLVQPRIALRNEWSSPFNLNSQKLKRGVKLSKQADLYILTYGHFLNRMKHVDAENDIVLFDEFHELLGEMILAESEVQARVFLMSATPVDVSTLKNTITLAPPIKKRFKTKIYKMDGDLSAIQMFQMGKNHHPDLVDRALIVQPVKRQVRETVAQLQWLGHKGTEFSSDQREVPKTGIVCSTPYIDAGMDLKPAAKILFDTGKYLAIDRGGPPEIRWTDPARDKQRTGRVSRMCDGVVYKNPLAGTGKPCVQYPGGFMFDRKVLSKFYGVPQLTPHTTLSSLPGLPYLHVDVDKFNNLIEVKSVLALHAVALTGEQSTKYRSLYNKLLCRDRLGEEQWWIEGIIYTKQWNKIEMLPWEEALSLLAVQQAVAYCINDTIEYRGPIKPVGFVWQDAYLDNRNTEEKFEKQQIKPLDNDTKLARVAEILSRLKETADKQMSQAVKSTLYADVSRITASILAN